VSTFVRNPRSLVTGPAQTRYPCGANPGALARAIRKEVAMTGGHRIERGQGTSRGAVPVPSTAAATTSSQSGSLSRTTSRQAPEGLASRSARDGASSSHALPPRNSPPGLASHVAQSRGQENVGGTSIVAPRPVRAPGVMRLHTMDFDRLSAQLKLSELQEQLQPDVEQRRPLLFAGHDEAMYAVRARLAAVAAGAAESLVDTALLRRALATGSGACGDMLPLAFKCAPLANVTIIARGRTSEETRQKAETELAGYNDKLQECVRRAADFHDIADAVVDRKGQFAPFKTTIDGEMRQIARRLAYTESVGAAIIAAIAAMRVGHARLWLAGLPPEVDRELSAVKEGYEALDALRKRLADAAPLTSRSDPRALSGPKELRAALKTISDAKEAFAQAAAEHLDQAAWPLALDIATAIGHSSACYERAIDVLHPLPTAPASAPERAGRSRRGRHRPAARSDAQEAAPGPSAERASNPRTSALQKSNRLLRGSRLSAEMLQSTGAELLALGRAAGKDVSTLEAVRDGREPTSIASQERTLLRNWFGDVDKLAQARAEIAALLDAQRGDQGLTERLAELEGQIAGLRVAERRIDATETDSLKQHEEPKSKHLERLLRLGEIASISKPIQLPSEGDLGGRGTLFELKILPKPLSDGRPARPLYVHVHLRELASEDEFRAVAFKDFAAVHVKTDWQKNKGPRWEQLQHAMGNTEARVHRGSLDEQVWDALRKVGGSD